MGFWTDDFVKFCFGGAAIGAIQIALWICSIGLANVSIVDIFWGMLFAVQTAVYFIFAKEHNWQNLVILILICIHSLRLSIFIGVRNAGKGEDKRYVKMRENVGESYWWVSFFTVFMLQGVLNWAVGACFFSAVFYSEDYNPVVYWIAVITTFSGTLIESVADQQLSSFKANPQNKGKVLSTGVWRYSRHPNYFGETLYIWGVYLFSIANYSYWTFPSAILMTAFIIKVSGVTLLEAQMLEERGEEYKNYVLSTSAFIPWCRKKLD